MLGTGKKNHGRERTFMWDSGCKQGKSQRKDPFSFSDCYAQLPEAQSLSPLRSELECFPWLPSVITLNFSSKVHFNLYFHTDRVNLNNNYIEADF